MTTKVNVNAVANFAQVTNPKQVQSTLFSMALRDASSNPDLYSDSEIIEELTALHHLLGNLVEQDE